MAQSIIILGKVGTGKSYLAAQLARGWPRNYIAVYDPMYCLTAPDSEYPWLHDAEDFTKSSVRPGMLILLDEVDKLASPHAYREKWFRDLFHYCRHLGITVISTARRPANVHNDILALAGEVYLGQITLDADIRACVRNWGEPCAKCKTLSQHEFMRFVPGEF